ncbi:AMIN-like domain-containing (lipo)protein [Corynebacterium striatum]|uniref:AMIN-like domain-containing (lipo)protein n=1 Tax=Corynebacterium striatum TaxID=43770 RepID=UPI000D763344|nr:hypothetical protein [Corynebacterium striatum]PXY04158.1 hypothetical protein CKF53_11805 [Corynebacterium striatum]VFB07906.1 putative secreted protein [Corynebacterium striatum]HCD3016317.1 hypothetical protein [Corynebacterium striatum]HCT3317469.1 hypothetical protein [Corynebacterium striatum]
MPKTSSLAPVLAALTLGAVALAACSSVSENAAAPTSTFAATLSGDVNQTSAPAGITPLGETNMERKTERPQAPSKLVVTDVRVGKHDGFERVVFEFTGDGSPGWFIDYDDKPTQQGSGNPITYKGSTALNVNIDGTVYPFEMDMPDPHIGTTEGTSESGGFITQVISSGTFEGRSQFVVGMNTRHPYSVQVLRGPTRLVIDVLAAT